VIPLHVITQFMLIVAGAFADFVIYLMLAEVYFSLKPPSFWFGITILLEKKFFPMVKEPSKKATLLQPTFSS